MTEYSNLELARLVKRLEVAIEKVEDKAITAEHLDLRIKPLEVDVIELQEANRWLTRAVVGAMITAIFSSVVAAVIGVVIRVPPL